MCDVLLGGPGMCDKVWQGEGGQNWPNIARRIGLLYGRPHSKHYFLFQCCSFIL